MQLPSELLRPSWQPFYPSNFSSPPPPLPPSPNPGCILVYATPTVVPSRKSHLHLSFPPTISSTSTPFTSPRKQSQRQIPKKLDDNNDGLTIPDFAPLPGFPETACYQPQELVVWHRPTVFNIDIARPQHMLEGPIAGAPVSILYDVFAQRVNELERDGLLS